MAGIALEDTSCSVKWMVFSERLEVWTMKAEAWTEGSESRQVQTRARRAESRPGSSAVTVAWAGSGPSPSLQLLSRTPALPCCPLEVGSEQAAHSTNLSLLGLLWSCLRLLTVDCQELCGGQEMVQPIKCLPHKCLDLLQISRTHERARHSVNNPSASENSQGCCQPSLAKG